jgi:uncharacterized phiE125 gp8 family phage protein
MILVLATAPAIEPITRDELKLHIRLDPAAFDEDSLLDDIIQAAREHVEDTTRRALLTQTWDMHLSGWPSGTGIKIPFGNLQSVTHVKYTDTDGAQTAIAVGTDYTVETNGDQCGLVRLPYGGAWPSASLGPSNPIVIRLVAGWVSAAVLPSKIRTSIKMICHDLYENRESQAFEMSGQYLENKTAGLLLSSMRLMDESW